MTQNGHKKQVRLFILNDPSMLRISPELAVEIGLAESIALLQLEYLIGISTTEERDGEIWTYQSLSKLRDQYFKFWSRATVNRVLRSLEKKGLIKIANYNKFKFDRTYWYCLNREGIEKLGTVKIETSMYQNETSKRTKRDMESNKMKHARTNLEHPCAQNETTIPEIPTETSSEISTETIPYNNAGQLWAAIAEQLQASMRSTDYQTWVANAKPIGFDAGRFYLATVNKFAADWITSRLGTTITNLLAPLCGGPVTLEVIVRPEIGT